MAQTDVTIDSNLFANPSDVPIVQGATLTVTASGGPVTLFFSHDCQSLLSPSPGASMALAPGNTLTFTFTTSHSGSYIVAVGESLDVHPHFPPIKSTTLTFTPILQSGRVGSGPNSQLQGN